MRIKRRKVIRFTIQTLRAMHDRIEDHLEAFRDAIRLAEKHNLRGISAHCIRTPDRPLGEFVGQVVADVVRKTENDSTPAEKGNALRNYSVSLPGVSPKLVTECRSRAEAIRRFKSMTGATDSDHLFAVDNV